MQVSPDLDVLIIGAGITGIGVACQLERNLPDKSYAILESRERLGGTWDLFRYPGIRSDVDMYTFGYSFNPWRDPVAIAEGEAIRGYLGETADRFGVTDNIRFGHSVTSADWSSENSMWTVKALDASTGESVTLTARWIFSATGYFRYDHGHTPEFAGIEDFAGTVIHPQKWPQELDYSGKRVVVIGSGATAVTLIPSMAGTAEHVTMLQRSPTYVIPTPKRDPVVMFFSRFLSPDRVYAIARRKSIFTQEMVWNMSKKRPNLVRKWIIKTVTKQLPEGYDVDKHFTPKYNPWDQRLCVVPGGDMFRAIRKGTASVVTDQIDHFTANGILLKSGEELPADIVVTATGLDLLALGGVEFSTDGAPVEISQTITYKGMMLSDLPNLMCSFPYPHVAWTIRVEVVAEYFQRVLEYMDKTGRDTCVAVNSDPNLKTHPFGDYTSNYVLRAKHLFPQSGDREPWDLDLKLRRDAKALRTAAVEDGTLSFSRSAGSASTR
ncbi:MAG: NAD(P)/FAD-dependent oxidoreductase [Actinomycetes bacterium]